MGRGALILLPKILDTDELTEVEVLWIEYIFNLMHNDNN